MDDQPADASRPLAEPMPATAGEAARTDSHAVRPGTNWREFLAEIAIVVIGVLIALGLEQAVQAWNWRNQVESSNVGVGKELSESVGQGAERIKLSDCVDRRLDQLAALVDQAATSGQLPAIGDVAMPPLRTWSSGVWESTIAGQTAEHLSNQRRNGLSVIYGFVTLLRETNDRELEDWTSLYAMVGPGRTLPTAEAAELRHAISKARADNQIMGLAAVRVEQATTNFRVGIDRLFERSFDQPRNDYAICRPLGRVPLHYGGAPIAGAIARARLSPIGIGRAPAAVTGASVQRSSVPSRRSASSSA